MHKKLMKMMQRQGALAAKAASEGKLTTEEKTELGELNAAITALTTGEVEVGKTELTTMTIADFKKHVEVEQAKADMNPPRLALLKRNIDSVKKQGKANATDVVAVEVLATQSEDDKFVALEEKFNAKLDEVMAAIKSGFDGRTTTGIATGGDVQPDADVASGETAEGNSPVSTGKSDGTKEKAEDAKASTSLALEAINSVIERFQKIKDKINSNENITMEEIRNMWPDWQVENYIKGAVGIIAKMDVAKTLLEEVAPKLEDLSKAEGEKDKSDESNGDTVDDKETADGEDKEEKGVAKWAGGGDLSPSNGTSLDDYRRLKKSKFSY